MKISRILPGAAGIIALTSIVGFVDGKSESDVECFSRGKISSVLVPSKNIIPNDALTEQIGIKPVAPAYLVELKRGDEISKVLIDAISGRIISS